MFHWPSWEGTYGFPVNKARLAAKDFHTVLRHIESYKSKHQDKVKGIRFTLLTNSMAALCWSKPCLKRLCA